MNEAALKGAGEEAWRWAIGVAIVALAVGGVVAAIFVMPRAVEANHRACMAAYASDLHTDLAAFAQDPAWQAQYVEAIAACAR
ncbi:hypothetical protein [Paraburkholderia silvatlantica]|uniref:Uncharacterized protein n=1 Tax=Paraburkholderia silvatlantica TaxID=321895 RepID=A0A2U1A4W3_9BURK|nr:hypothetical protein [Paraburkholderia silvatlantica]MBB2931605.1 hypothetical protein [Paraburkholderia silvatlantica]PVY26604.1 hypothetical protein C7411_12367 [Paraburkholderia silvatlantica]PXW32869.1 hypothetical protein C7413_12267 [Paraburkholderia silvatlantica]PYE13658.1 hypothetical protein C7410_14434 [Paraburkholderia silvatlantica]TDQ81609.1 hypothetical protein C7412_12534 [Paraburkholderia silvatlantica]